MVMQMVITGMILIIIATATLAVLSYGAFKVRERRSPNRSAHSPDRDAPLFFERVRVTASRSTPAER